MSGPISPGERALRAAVAVMALVVLGLAVAIALRAVRAGEDAADGAPVAGPRRPARRVVVLVDSDPRGASVRLGDRILGTTPFEEVLEVGPQELLFEAPGHEAKSLEIDITRTRQVVRVSLTPRTAAAPSAASPGDPPDAGAPEAQRVAVVDAGVSLAAEPRSVFTRGRGRLTLRTTPAATVYLNERRIGDTPIVNLSVPAGSLVLRLVRTDTKEEALVEVEVRAKRLATKKYSFDEGK